ncbi:MAG: hypothetical protein JWP45_925 [Mucilaginibacter sp.]|nr:hypothetical protein [Mucilaginibacter sp.]
MLIKTFTSCWKCKIKLYLYFLFSLINYNKTSLMDSKLEERVVALEKLLGVLIADIRGTRSSISAGFEKIDNNFINIDKKFKKVDDDLILLRHAVDALSGQTDDDFKKVHVKLVSIKDEISKISSVTRYEEEYNNLKAIQGGKKS